MKRSILSLAAVCLGGILSLHAAVSPYFECNFEKGIPEDITLIDADSKDLHFTMVQLGFGDKDSWTLLREEGTENHYAASASRFKTSKGEDPVAAEDWLVTPPMWIRASDAKLTWEGMSVNDRNNKTSTYEVLVSTKGCNPEDFTGSPVTLVASEPIHEWTTHEVDLGEYVGQRVYIAFVNRSTDSEVLGIDNVCVAGSSGLADIRILPEEYTIGNEEICFGGTLTACTDEVVNTLSVSFCVGDEVFHADYSDLNLHCGERFEFILPETVKATYGDRVSFVVKSEVNDIPFDDMTLNTTLLAFLPKKSIVVEEATGMWCGYCPEGIVAMETLQERYPDEFIGIAVHVNDDMEVTGYSDVMPFPAGAPTAWIDRKEYCETLLAPITKDGIHTYTTLMGGVESMFLDRLSEQTFADVEVNGSYNSLSGDIDVTVGVKFAKRYEGSDLRVALVMTEDNVWKEGYYQTNYHSGRESLLNGFENRPPMIVDDFAFNHVARWVEGSYAGVPGSLPQDLEAATEYTWSAVVALPSDVADVENVKLIAMVADATTGEVMNASICGITNTSVSGIEDSAISVRCEKGTVTARAEGKIEMTVFDISGICVASIAGDGTLTKTDLPHGLYVVRIKFGNNVKTIKIAV